MKKSLKALCLHAFVVKNAKMSQDIEMIQQGVRRFPWLVVPFVCGVWRASQPTFRYHSSVV